MIWILFVVISVMIVPYHEPWADEIQALLIAQETGFYDLMTQIPRQEGHTPLWYLLLKLSAAVFGESFNIAYISVFIMSAAVGIFLFGCKIPPAYKFLLPFGHYFLYQYNIIARNYCLSYLALALLAALYEKRHIHRWPYAANLFLLAEASLVFALPAAALGFFWIAEAYKNHRGSVKNYYLPFGFLCIAGLFTLWQILPFNTTLYAARLSHIDNSPAFLPIHLAEAFFIGQNLWLNLLFMGLTAWDMIRNSLCATFYEAVYRNSGVVMRFVAVWGSFIPAYAFIRPMYYHQGLIWGLFLCSTYMFFPDYVRRGRHYLFTACAVMHIFWSVTSIRYDIDKPYSAQFGTMKILQQYPKEKITVAGYHTIPLKQLLGRNGLHISPEERMYQNWTAYDASSIQTLINRHDDILAVDTAEAANADLHYYQNPNKFYVYDIPAAAVYKGYIFFEQGILLFIKRKSGLSGGYEDGK